MSMHGIVMLLSLLMGLQPISTDLYLPALPALTEALGAVNRQAQWTLSSLLLAFGLAQLVCGPLSDRFGRRPVLLYGLGLYTLACILGALSTSLESLVLARTLQGVGLGAGLVCARAIVRDRFSGVQALTVMSRSLSGVGILATLAVPVGAMASTHLGWRLTLALPGLIGMVTWLLVLLRFDEDIRLPAASDAEREGYRRILANPGFIAFTAANSASYCGLFTLMACSPFVFLQELHLSTGQYGAVMSSVSAFFFLGTLVCRHLATHHGQITTLWVGLVLSLASALLLLLALTLSAKGIWAILTPCFLYATAHGIHHSTGQSGSISPFPRSAGLASALNGFWMMLQVFVMGLVLQKFMHSPIALFTAGIAFWALTTCACTLLLVQPYLRPRLQLKHRLGANTLMNEPD